MYEFRPNAHNVTAAELARVHQPGGALPWWNPDGLTPGGLGGACVGAYQAKAAVSYAASLVNLANPGTYNLIEGNGAVPWAALTGWGFVAAALQYFDTGIVPVVNVVSWSVLIQFADHAMNDNRYLFGLLDTVTVTALSMRYRTEPDRVVAYHGTSASASNDVGAMASGNFAIAAKQGYRDGIPSALIGGAGGGVAIHPLYIGAVRTSAGVTGWPTYNCRAFAAYNVTLTAPQVLARATAMAAL